MSRNGRSFFEGAIAWCGRWRLQGRKWTRRPLEGIRPCIMPLGEVHRGIFEACIRCIRQTDGESTVADPRRSFFLSSFLFFLSLFFLPFTCIVHEVSKLVSAISVNQALVNRLTQLPLTCVLMNETFVMQGQGV